MTDDFRLSTDPPGIDAGLLDTRRARAALPAVEGIGTEKLEAIAREPDNRERLLLLGDAAYTAWEQSLEAHHEMYEMIRNREGL
jgi:hypothetical protein